MAIEQQFDDSKEGLRKKRLRELAAQQEQEMKSSVPEPGAEEEDLTSIPMRKELIGKLKEKMPVAGEIADMVVPASIGGVPKGMSKMAGKLISPADIKSTAEKIRKMFMGQSTEKLAAALKLPYEKQKEMVEAGTKSAQKWASQKVAGKVKPANNPIPGKGQGEVDLGQYYDKAQQSKPVAKSTAPTPPENMSQKEFLDSLTDMSGAESGQQYNKLKQLKKKGY